MGWVFVARRGSTTGIELVWVLSPAESDVTRLHSKTEAFPVALLYYTYSTIRVYTTSKVVLKAMSRMLQGVTHDKRWGTFPPGPTHATTAGIAAAIRKDWLVQSLIVCCCYLSHHYQQRLSFQLCSHSTPNDC